MATINGNGSANTLNGTSNDDEIFGKGGDDKLNGFGGDDKLYGGTGNDTLNGGQGNDVYLIAVGDGADTFKDSGTLGTDTILATADNVLIGIKGGFNAGSGIEVIDAGGHTGVAIIGGTGNDVLNFSSTTLIGIDAIRGGSGNDTMTGSAGADVLNGGSGNDILNGGEGGDTYQVGAGAGVDTIKDTGTTGTDTIVATADNVAISLKSGFSAANGIEVIGAGGFAGVTITGGSGNDVFDFTGITLTGIASIGGGAGNDTVTGSAGADTLQGGAGNDILKGGEGGDTYLYGSGDGVDTITDTGTTGTDTILARADNVAITLKPGFSAATGIEAIDGGGHSGVTLLGGTGNDTFDFSGITLTGIASIDGGWGNDTITGSSGADSILGGAGNDILSGAGGEDRLSGGTGNDTMKGGADADLFVYSAGADKISDFVHGVDHIDVKVAGITDFETLMATGKQSGDNTVFTFSTGNTLTLTGVKLDTLDAEDFGLAPPNVTPPTFTSGSSGAGAENAAASNVVYTATVTDPDGAAPVFSLESGGDNALFSIDPATGEVRLLVAPDFEIPGDADKNNTYQIVIHANDGVNDASKAVTISVTDVNEAPVFTSGSDGKEDENTPISNVVYQAAATDPEGTALTYSLSSGGDNEAFSIDAATGEIRFKAVPDAENPADADKDNFYKITVHANDGVNETTQFVNITVNNVNDTAPVITSATNVTWAESTSTAVSALNVKVSDPDGATPTFSLAAGGDNALFSIDSKTGQVFFLNAPDFENPADVGKDNVYNIEVHVNDGVHEVTQSVAISVTNADDNKLIATADKVITNTASDVDFTIPEWALLANDSDADAGAILQISGVSNASGGTLGAFTPTAATDDAVVFKDTGVVPGGTFNYGVTAGPTSINVATVEISRVTGAVVQGGADGEILIGSSGNDQLFGGDGKNILFGGQGNDTIYSDWSGKSPILPAGDNTAFGGAGDDVVYGGNGNDTLTGGLGNDSVFGYSVFSGLNPEGDDTITDTDGDNSLYGGFGNDKITGGAGKDFVEGWVGDDTINGGDGENEIYGGTGNDTIVTGIDNDIIFGDSSYADTDVDTVKAGKGDDVVTFYHVDAGDNADGGEGLDTLCIDLDGTANVFNAATQTTFLNFEWFSIAGGAGNDTITGGADSDSLWGDRTGVGNGGDDTLNGGGGDDTLYGGDGNNTLNGGEGNDLIYSDFTATAPSATAGTNTADGGNGNDTIYGGEGADTLKGGSGNDTIYGYSGYWGDTGTDGKDTIEGGAGNDTINGGAGNDVINGGADNDLINGGIGNDTLIGDAGNDTLIGGDGIDSLIGHDNNDILIGGAGSDSLMGGAGFDTFRYTSTASGTDVIGDFLHAGDVIDLAQIDANTTAADDQAFKFVAADTVGLVANSITWHYDAGTNITMVQADTNGNAFTAEMTIYLQGKVALTATDFVL